ncbi:carboxypeptidase-like regulatory domain-containing protein [Gemmata sp. JC717]|uniref:carboxypeptidase-like regulatory domain-containing protein n=1 Tax=Gemmata algarum TaxID=2975278 RepID=UPI0021BB229E|nr:carboxypeptidase-like regulatory domain-containing protein [Gemmata algarum]MDY3551519.1 carboxypeptidase-like regulatory domain-containing protein [Gemmata algarum]
MTIWRTVATLGAVAVALGSTACSSDFRLPATSLSGKVTVNGKPLSGGVVTAYRGSSKVMEASIEVDGNYTFADPPSGEYYITVTKTDTPSTYSRPVRLPTKYADPGSSGLRATVVSDRHNTQDLPLSTK